MMKPNAGWGVVCLLTCLPFSMAIAQPKAHDARGLLERVSSATRSLNYDGTFVYLHENGMETMRVIHKSDGAREQERLITLNGHASEVIRSNDKVFCVLPNSRKVIIEKAKQGLHSFPAILSKNFSQVEDYYHVKTLRTGRVAGRSTQGVQITPKDAYRYGYRLWVDDESGLLLKTELLDGNNVVEQVVFTSLELKNDIADSLLKPSVDVSGFTEIRDQSAAPSAADMIWNISWLPGGFSVNASERVNMDEKTSADHIIVSDGLSMVSVFIEPGDEKAQSGPSRKGALNAYRHVVDGYHVTVVGEVPQQTVKSIATSVKPQPPVASIND